MIMFLILHIYDIKYVYNEPDFFTMGLDVIHSICNCSLNLQKGLKIDNIIVDINQLHHYFINNHKKLHNLGQFSLIVSTIFIQFSTKQNILMKKTELIRYTSACKPNSPNIQEKVSKNSKGINEQSDKIYIGQFKYSEKEILGSGVSSKVYKAVSVQKPKEKYAIKVIDLKQYNNIDLLEMEINTLMSINHPNVIKCLDVIKTQKVYYLIMEYCPHGDLEQLIRLQKFIPEDRAIFIMKQVLEGYKALLSKGIIHRDLKPANIMRFGDNWKIGDFGFARFCKDDFLLQKLQLGTPLYLPLECLTLNKYSIKSDFFSLGVIFYEMIFGNTPWPVKTEQQLINQMKKCEKVDIVKGAVCQQSYYFLRKTLQIDFYKRISKEQFKNFSFQGVDIQVLARNRSPKGVSPKLRRALSSQDIFKQTTTGKELEKISSPKKKVNILKNLKESPISPKFLKSNNTSQSTLTNLQETNNTLSPTVQKKKYSRLKKV